MQQQLFIRHCISWRCYGRRCCPFIPSHRHIVLEWKIENAEYFDARKNCFANSKSMATPRPETATINEIYIVNNNDFGTVFPLYEYVVWCGAPMIRIYRKHSTSTLYAYGSNDTHCHLFGKYFSVTEIWWPLNMFFLASSLFSYNGTSIWKIHRTAAAAAAAVDTWIMHSLHFSCRLQ